MTRRLLPLLILAALWLALPTLAQDDDISVLDLTYYLNDASIAFAYNADWTVIEVDPRGSVIVADSRDTLSEFVTEPGDFQMSIFSPSFIVPNFGDDLESALNGILDGFFSGLQMGAVVSTEIAGRPALRSEYMDEATAEGFIIAFETPDGTPAVATVSAAVDGLDDVEADILAILASVENQQLSDLALEPFTTAPIGPQGSRFTLGLPAGWTVEQQGLRILATNAASVDAFSAAPGEFLLVVSPRFRSNIMMVDFPTLEQNALPDGFDPRTAALGGLTDSGANFGLQQDGVEPPNYVVANRWNDPLVALVRVLHAPDEADAALGIALAVRPTIAPALPEGLVPAELPELNFVAGVQPEWFVTLNQGASMLITPVPVDEMTQENWAMVVSSVRTDDPETTWNGFIEQTGFTTADMQSGQLPNGQIVFRAAIPGDDTAPIRWAVTTPDGQDIFLISIFSPAGDNTGAEALLEATISSLRLR